MIGFYFGITLFLVLTLLGGLVRILRGPTRADRMLAAQLFGTTGVAILLVLSAAAESAALRDAALVFALLAAVNTIVFVQHARAKPREREEQYVNPDATPP
jgi:multicomponent Na+:H+ antiporter subunit F